MKERERVLELVKKGVLSTEEALVLLENMATEKEIHLTDMAAKKIKHATDDSKTTANDAPISQEEPSTADVKTDVNLSAEDKEWNKYEELIRESEKMDKVDQEELLSKITEEINVTSSKLDRVNERIPQLIIDVKAKNEKLMTLNTQEELGVLGDTGKQEQISLEQEITQLNNELDQLNNDKVLLETELSSLNKESKENDGRSRKKMDIPEEWLNTAEDFKETASETFNQFSDKMTDAGNSLGKFLKQTFNQLSDTFNENVDWKDVNIKVPGVATTKFQHEFYYPDNVASIVNIRVANGEVEMRSWDQLDVKIEAKIKLYGKMDADTPLEAFLERSEIEVNDESISIQVPNKRIRCDLVIYLPAHTYDHVSLKILNGGIQISDIVARDAYAKLTNGNMSFDNFTATMLEVSGVNGNIQLTEGNITDFLADSVNGDIIVKGAVEHGRTSLVNGSIKVTATEKLRRLEASAVNGTLKIALPTTIGVEALAKTNLGSIQQRLSDIEVIREKKEKTNQLLQFRRINDAITAQLNISTTTGNVLFKDTDK